MKATGAFLLTALIALTITFAMPRLTRVEFIDTPSIATALPDNAGPWKGKHILYCQNPDHGAVLFLETHPATCPECGGMLSSLSPFETEMLPKDTRADKRQYMRDDEIPLQVALVFSGRDRSSIHRPEVCMVSDRSTIVASQRRSVAVPGHAPIEVQLLDIQHTAQTPDGRSVTWRSYFAYWFAGRGHETASHLVRMFWMAWDRILWNRAYPWAYVSIAGTYDQPGDLPLRRLDDLVRDLYPLMHPEPAARPAATNTEATP